ncbi:MAG: FAD-dependent oxidoreductase, partial [Emcibacter sp.]|nr:FAD-dependent oxidoreductase [Emcibacter sp.]
MLNSEKKIDVIVIGAGPAGMAASIEASRHGASVLLLDEQPTLGGQIYRNIEKTSANNPAEFKLLGPDYQIGLELAHSVKNQNINHVKGAEVWNIEHDTMAVFYA